MWAGLSISGSAEAGASQTFNLAVCWLTATCAGVEMITPGPNSEFEAPQHYHRCGPSAADAIGLLMVTADRLGRNPINNIAEI